MSVNRRHFSDSSVNRYKSNLISRPDDEDWNKDLLRHQLSLEHKLQDTCQQLLHYYKEGHDWAAVSQVAQNLITGAQRIAVLKEQLSGGCCNPRLLDSISELEDSLGSHTSESSDKRGEAFSPVDDAQDSAFCEENNIEETIPEQSQAFSPLLVSMESELTVRVSEAFDPESGEECYLVDTQCSKPYTNQSVLHKREEFGELGEKLAAKAKLPELWSSNKDCQGLADFLETAVHHPVLRREPALMDFLGVKAAYSTTTYEDSKDEPTMNGEEGGNGEDSKASPNQAVSNGNHHDAPSPPTSADEATSRLQQGDSPITFVVSPEANHCMNGYDSSENATTPYSRLNGVPRPESADLPPTHKSPPHKRVSRSGSDPTLATNEDLHDGSLPQEVETIHMSLMPSPGPESADLPPTHKSPPHKRVSRSGSDPTLATNEDLHDGSLPQEVETIHMSLMPSPGYPTKAMSSEDITGVDTFGKVNIKRQRSVPSQLSKQISKTKKAIGRRSSGVLRSVSFKRFTLKGRKMSETPTRSSDSVQLLKTIPSQEWDPSCLLEELYSDHKQLVSQNNASGESARHFGYLEKLPVGKSRPSVFGGWKRRYFRAMEGNIYYYETRSSEKALGFARLSNARIICDTQKLQVQVVDKTGSVLMMKAPNGSELNEWHRALQLESAHPTMTTPTSPPPVPSGDTPVVIIDIGACSVRAGFAGEKAYPQVFFPAVCSMDAATLDPIDCGLNALLPQNRYGSKLIYPRKRRLRMDKSDKDDLNLQALYSIIFAVIERLSVEPQACYLLLTLPSTTRNESRDELAEMLLAHIGFAGIYFQDQAVLALYSYNTTSGIVVDIGDHIDVIPLSDGYTLEAGVTRLPLGGNAITDNLSKLITAKGIRYFSETEAYINRFIKENLCYVSQDFDNDCAKCEENPTDYLRAAEMDRFQLPDHRKVIVLDSALFKAPEGLFNPFLWGKDIPGIHELVWKAVQQCPIDQRKELQRNIYLSGATTLLPGIKERLQKELSQLAPQGTVIEVHASGTQQHAAYMGASVLAGLSSFQKMLVTHEEWNSQGPDALQKWDDS